MLFMFSILLAKSFAQTNIDTLQQCKKIANNGNINAAYKLIEPFVAKHSNNFDAIWFAAKLAYWNWDIAAAKSYYSKGIELNNKHYYIKLDCAKMLVDIGDYKQAIELLEQYIAYDKTSKEAQLYLIKANYYNGNIATAKTVINALPNNIKNTEQIKQLQHEIAVYNAVNIMLSTAATIDDQPMHTITPSIQIAKQHNNFLNWYVKGSSHFFSNDTFNTNAYNVQVGNKFLFNKLKLNADVSVGIAALNANNTNAIIGSILLSKKINNAFSLNIEATRNPYYYSISSTHTNVMQDNFGAAIVINNLKKITGKLQYQQQNFNDNNVIENVSGWLLSPAISNKFIALKVGYSYQYSNSLYDNYTSTKSVSDVIQNYNTTTIIPAWYLPYFTPKNQQIHSALAWLQLKPVKDLSITLSGSHAIKASLQNPYLLLTKDDVNQTIIGKDFIEQDYKPANYKANISYKLNERIKTFLNYEYLKTAYYTANIFSLSVNLLFIDEK